MNTNRRRLTWSMGSTIAHGAAALGAMVACAIEEGQILCRGARETGAVVQVGTQQRSDRVRFLNAVANHEGTST
jgi:hypothetical protein